MANYIPIGAGYTPIGGQPFVSPKKKFPHLKGIERERALYNQEMNPRRSGPQGYGGLADKYAAEAIDPITNLPASMSEFDLGNVRNNLAKAGELEALNLFNNYQQKLPGSAEALMEFRNMRQAQQQFAQRPAAQPQNPYTPPAQNKPLYIPSGQPQPPANVPQLAGDVAAAVGRTMGGPASPQVPSSIGTTLTGAVPPAPRAKNADGTPASWNVNPSLWTPEAMARANPYGASSRPLPTHPNDMRGQSRGYGLVYSSGGSSNIAPAGGKVAGWSPTYSGDRQAPVSPQRSTMPQNPYQAAPQPVPFDMAAAVARNRAALDAKYPTPEIPAAGVGNVALQPTARTPLDFMQGQKPEDRLATIDRIMNPPVRPPEPIIAASPARTPLPVAPTAVPAPQVQVAQEPTIMQNIGRHFGQSPIGTEFSRAGSEALQGTKDAISGVKQIGSSLANSAMQNPNFRDSILGKYLAKRNPYMATR